MAGLLAPGPTIAKAEELRKRRGSRGLLEAVGEPMAYAPNPVVSAIGQGLLGARYLTGEKPMDEGLASLSDMTAMGVGSMTGPIMRAAKGIPTGIKSAAVKVGEKTYLGTTHGQAANKAVYEGTLVRGPDGRLRPTKKGERINWDLFLTNDDQLIDRLTADRLFSAGAAETALEMGIMKAQPARSFAGSGQLSPELSRLLYGD